LETKRKSLGNVSCFNSVQLSMAYDSGNYDSYSVSDISGVYCSFTYVNPSSWNENTLTWNSQSVQLLGFDDGLTWANSTNGNYLYISFQITTASSSLFGLYSREGGYPANVTITYCEAGYTCTSGKCIASNPTPTTSSSQTPGNPSNQNAGAITAGVLVPILSLIIIGLVLYYFFIYRKRAEKGQKAPTKDNRGVELDPLTMINVNSVVTFGDGAPPPKPP